MSEHHDRPVARTLWRSTDGGRSWRSCAARAGSIVANGVGNHPDGWWDDGFGNLYRDAAPPGPWTCGACEGTVTGPTCASCAILGAP